MAHEGAMSTHNPSDDADAAGRRAAAQKARRFGLIATLVLAAVMTILTAFSQFDPFGAGVHLSIAFILGVGGAILLGVGLMALSFYSDRAGVDDGVVGMNDDHWDDADKAP